jgi:hypothetical protein
MGHKIIKTHTHIYTYTNKHTNYNGFMAIRGMNKKSNLDRHS